MLPENEEKRKPKRINVFGEPNTNGHRIASAGPTELPDVTGLSNAEAAEVYAEAGFFLTPTRPGTKAPYLDRWPERATCDLDTVREHWRNHPDDGIAIHVGGCRLLVIDVDTPDIVAEWLWPLLEQAAFRPTTSDPQSRRGHYFYRLRPGEMFNSGRARLKPPNRKAAGFDVRCDGGAIVLGPTYHPRAAEDGHYATGPTAPIPFRPDEIADKLNPASGNGDTRMRGTPAELAEQTRVFLATYTDDRQPNALTPILRNFIPTPGERHPTVWDTLCWAMREAKAGCFPAQRAVDELRKLWNPATHGREDFDRMVRDAIGEADADGTVEELRIRKNGFAGDIADWAPTTIENEPASGYKVFQVMGPTEWAAPVADPEFMIGGALCSDTFGPNAGPKKSLKTHDNQAVGLALATGQNLYLCEHFPVPRARKVLYIVGEGGSGPVRRTLRRMARAYGVDPADIARDPQFPLTTAFGTAPLDSERFIDDLKRLLDAHQPDLALIESFYNFHPSDVQAGDLYQRGQIIDGYHKMILSECEGATSLMTDHYRSTGVGKSLDLDSISMAGQAENADSWITRYHRKDPNVPAGEFWLRTGFNSRQWGGTEWNIDWHLGRFDHTVGHHVGEIGWDVSPAVGGPESADVDETLLRILQIVKDNEFEYTKSQVVKDAGGKREITFRKFNELEANHAVILREVPDKKNDRVGLGANAERLFRLAAAGTGSRDQEPTGTDKP